jgi:hypothetical protein
MRTSKLKPIEAHGKIESEKPTTLEQCWGSNEMAKYGTINEQEYAAQIEEMNSTDLHAHARKVGVVVVESVARLRTNLLSEFRSYVTYLHAPATQASAPTKSSKEVQAILNEGR